MHRELEDFVTGPRRRCLRLRATNSLRPGRERRADARPSRLEVIGTDQGEWFSPLIVGFLSFDDEPEVYLFLALPRKATAGVGAIRLLQQLIHKG